MKELDPTKYIMRYDMRGDAYTFKDWLDGRWTDYDIHYGKYGIMFILNADESNLLEAGLIAAVLDDEWEDHMYEQYGERGEPDIDITVAVYTTDEWLSEFNGKTCPICDTEYQLLYTVRGGKKAECSLWCECSGPKPHFHLDRQELKDHDPEDEQKELVSLDLRKELKKGLQAAVGFACTLYAMMFTLDVLQITSFLLYFDPLQAFFSLIVVLTGGLSLGPLIIWDAIKEGSD